MPAIMQRTGRFADNADIGEPVRSEDAPPTRRCPMAKNSKNVAKYVEKAVKRD
jgi:hypothetical protein